MSTWSQASLSTVCSHWPKVGIIRLDEPQATSCRSELIMRIARPVSAAMRPYSSAVLCPICQGPSISLPRHHSCTPWGSSAVSYTHLRAHETRHDLVCRLLL